MKKGILVACLSLLLITGCGDNTEKTMTCSRTMDQSGIKADLQYTVTYKGNTVVKVHTIEKMESDTVDLEALKEQVENTYAAYNELEHYDTNVTIDGNVLTSTADIDYSKIDTEKMLKIDSALGQIIKDGKVNIDDLKTVYEAAGATCKK